MPTPTIKKMGKAKGPVFVDNLTHSSPVKKSNLPMLILIVVGGVAALWVLRSKSNFASNTAGSTTNPAVSINGGSAPDQSTIDNLTASILALQGQVYNSSVTPGGGSSTPITPLPSQTNPPSGNGAGTLPTPVNTNPTGAITNLADFTSRTGMSPQQWYNTVRANAAAGTTALGDISALKSQTATAQAAYDKIAASNPLSGSSTQVQANSNALNALQYAQANLANALAAQKNALAGGVVGSTTADALGKIGAPPDANVVHV